MKKALIFFICFLILSLPAPVFASQGIMHAELIHEGQYNEQAQIQVLKSNDEEAKAVIFEGLKNRSAKINLEGYRISSSDIGQIYSDVINLNPELFYVKGGFRYWSEGIYVVAIEPSYSDLYSNEDMLAFYDKADYVLSTVIEDGMTEEDKVLAIHDYITENCMYDQDNLEANTLPPQVFNAYGAIVNEIAVCQGYSLAFQYFMNCLNIDCRFVASEEMNHGWNMVRLGDDWYQIDVTWDDPIIYSGTERVHITTHNYFLRSDDTFLNPQTGNSHFGWVSSLPKCESNKYEEGYFFNEIATPFVYRNGAFWTNDQYTVNDGILWKVQNFRYYSTDFSGENKKIVPQNDYEKALRKEENILGHPVIHAEDGKIEKASLENVGRGRIAIKNGENKLSKVRVALAYYSSDGALLSVELIEKDIPANGFSVAEFTRKKPEKATYAKILYLSRDGECIAPLDAFQIFISHNI